MENNQIKHISDLIGKGIQVKEKQLTPKQQEEEFFLHIVNTLSSTHESSLAIEEFGIDLVGFEMPYLDIIFNLLVSNYGEIKASIIFWWVFESQDEEGNFYGIIDENDKEHVIKTPKQLYKFLKQYDK